MSYLTQYPIKRRPSDQNFDHCADYTHYNRHPLERPPSTSSMIYYYCRHISSVPYFFCISPIYGR